MAKKPTPAQSQYEAAVNDLKKFCEDNTDLEAYILDGDYPIRVQFIPKPQLTIFGNDNVDEYGEINDLTVTVGLSTSVKSTLKFKMDAKLLKKLIKMAEKVGSIYYLAFRETEGARTKPTRPSVIVETGEISCPCCQQELADQPSFCPICGQAIDWTEEPTGGQSDE